MSISLLINTNYTRKSFTILADNDDSMNDCFNSKVTNNLPAISNKIKSVFHRNCVIPNEDFSIFYNSISGKLQPPSQQITISNKNSYPFSKEFFNKVSSKLRDLRPKVTPKKEELLSTMERPMFITTVKSGTFLEPPPEVAALLGLRKNSFNSNTNSSNSSTGKTQNNDRMYSFASKPRILKSNLQTNFATRSLFRVETRREKRETLHEPLPKITNDTSDGVPSYGNTMFDRRVARGSNFAAQRPNVISTEHVLSRQAEARRRAAVRQRAQIRARKLRLGTPPPIDGRRHGQIQTDKYLEELTERPPDKSIACQADLPEQRHSPVYFLDSNSNIRTGVEAETQIYPGDLPDIDDELPSVISSIVNKILQEAILEINDEIEVIRLRTLASEQKHAGANSLPSDENGIITKTQLHMLIQQAINELRQSEQSDSNETSYDDINSNRLLEKIFDQIKNMITDVKFLSGIIRTQLENWAEDSNQNDQIGLERAKIEQFDEENETISNTETVCSRRESLAVANELENQTNEGLEQMDTEIEDYKTDFEEESKDLAVVNEDEIEVSNTQNDLNTDSNFVNHDSDTVNGLRTIRSEDETVNQPSFVNKEVNSLQQFTEIAEEPTITANEATGERNDKDNDISNQNTNPEPNKADRDISNYSESQINKEKFDNVQAQPSVIIFEQHEEANELSRHDDNQTSDILNTINESADPPKAIIDTEESSEAINIIDTSNEATNNSGRDNDQSSDANIDDAAQSSRNNVLDPPVNDSNPENKIVVEKTSNDSEQSSENTTSTSLTNQPALTIPTLDTSVLDPPIGEPNPEYDIIVIQTANIDAEQSLEDFNSTNQQTITIPTLNKSVLDPPIRDSNPEQDEVVTQTSDVAKPLSEKDDSTLLSNQPFATIPTSPASVLDPPASESNLEHDIVVIQRTNNDIEQPLGNNSTIANQTLTVPGIHMSLLDPSLNDSNPEDETTIDIKEQSSRQEPFSANPSNGDKDENSSENSTNSSDNNTNSVTTTEPNNSDKIAFPENAINSPENDPITINNTELSSSDGNMANNIQTDEQTTSSNQRNPNDSIHSSNELTINQNDEAVTESSTNPITENLSSEQTIEREFTTTSEDDNDVVAIHSSSAENQDRNLEDLTPEITDTNKQTSEPLNTINTELQTSSDNNTFQNDHQDISTNNNNNEKLTDDDLEKISSTSTKPELSQDESLDTESLENNELQHNMTTPEDSNSFVGNSENRLDEDQSVQEPEKPIVTESILSSANDQLNELNQSNDESAAEVKQSGQNSETVSNSSNTDSLDVTVSPTSVSNTTISLNQEVSRPFVNGLTEPDDNSSNQSDIEVKNNNTSESIESDKSVETNNNDLAIQSKQHPTTIVQNGNILTNR